MPTTNPGVRRLAAATTAALASACAVTAMTPGTAAAATSREVSPAAAYLAFLNHERVAHGRAPLTPRADLSRTATRWAAQMASMDSLEHNPDLVNQVANWQVIGENVGVGPTVRDLAVAFWDSPEHRANILDREYDDVGVGAVTRDGVIWITVDFRDPLHPEPRPVATHPAQVRATVRHRSVHRHSVARHRAAHRTLRYGMTGADVAAVQRRLHVGADGIFGPITRQAVRGFQHRHAIRPDGVVGPRTWAALTR